MRQTGVPDTVSLEGFLLTRQWRDVPVTAPAVKSPPQSGRRRPRQLQLEFWLTSDSGPVKVVLQQQTAVFFLPAEQQAQAQAHLQRLLGLSARHPALTPQWELRPLHLQSFDHQPVVGVYFREQRTLYRARELLVRQGLTPLEADIQPTDRFLMERFICGAVRLQGVLSRERGLAVMHNPQLLPGADYQPRYRVLSLDIETSLTGDHLYSVAVLLTHTGRDETGTAEPEQQRVWMLNHDPEQQPPTSRPWLSYCADERSLLEAFFDWFEAADPDMIIGWNVINFDLRFLQRKADALQISLPLGRQRQSLDWRQSRGDDTHYTLLVPGRVVLDGIDTLRSATHQFESFALDSVARELLGRGKLSDDVDQRAEQITLQFQTDKPALADYNLEDCRLVWDIFVAARLFDFATERARLTGLAMDRFGGSVAAFDNRYLPRLHRQGFVAPMLQDEPEGVGSPGGYVMDSLPGIYDHVLVLDFKSLYPSIIRTFHIDPLARVAGAEWERSQGIERPALRDRCETEDVDRSYLVPGFNGAVFDKQVALLPDLIDELWQARDRAKQQHNSAMSQAIKILMNSFYGVLGTPGCRFFDYRLPSSITLRGHQVLNRSRQLIEAQGHRVIYGDTDSVFVCLQGVEGESLSAIQARGKALAASLNDWWRQWLQQEYQLPSHLEIEFETHYSRFVMPTIRGADTGSKKRYCGLVEQPDGPPQLVFKGLEAVRTDWTPLAREFQRELYRRVFMGETWDDYLLQTLERIRCGEADALLVYRKRIRRRLADYTRNVPPHVQAARRADQWLSGQGRATRYQRGGWIRYLLTVNGPEPLECHTSALDYELYIERQIAPIADGILHFLGTSFAEVTGRQLGLFD